MKKILAVSGGVDSVVLLHQMRHDPDAIVAHFDHGIRANSIEDYSFVEKLAEQYGLPFCGTHAALGTDCSEAQARAERYNFLFQVCRENRGILYTAHHADDAVETAVINLLRGTGWRGLAPLDRQDIERPLLTWRKADIYRYAAQHGLHFRYDQSNSDPCYLRNRIRQALVGKPTEALAELIKKQYQLRQEIQNVLAVIITSSEQLPRQRLYVDDIVAAELLREFLRQNHLSLTRPQLQRCLAAARDYQAGSLFSLDERSFLKIGRYYCTVVE